MTNKHHIPIVLILAFLLFLVSSNTIMAKNEARPKVGLVLGGGGAKGAAEVGVLKVLEELNVPIDYIAGTSIGAIVGGLYACGYNANELDSLFRKQEWLTLFGNRNKDMKNSIFGEEDGTFYIMGFPIASTKSKKDKKDDLNKDEVGMGILSGRQVMHLLDSLTKKYDGIESFDLLPIPFRCVAVDIKTQEEIIMDSCELELAMRASMAIPGAFKPVRWKGHTLVDGGMMNNLPVDVVRQMGADVVIAVDLEQDEHEERDFSLKETFGIGGILDWAVSRPDWKKNKANMEDADVYIHPELIEYDVTSFSMKSIDGMIERGEKAARSKAKEIMGLLKRK